MTENAIDLAPEHAEEFSNKEYLICHIENARLDDVNLRWLYELRDLIAKVIEDEKDRIRNEIKEKQALLESDAVSTAKFVNPANPKQTWSGRGKKPRWYVEQSEAEAFRLGNEVIATQEMLAKQGVID